MAEQKKKETRPSKPAEGGDGAAASPELAKKGKKIKEDIDKLLDEIDDILEENAEEFVKSYELRPGVREVRRQRRHHRGVPRVREPPGHAQALRLRPEERRQFRALRHVGGRRMLRRRLLLPLTTGPFPVR
ncbi:MAG: ubiquitin-like protein Pup [Candidatus Rokubacteria bacterium]|nr:ubiquitin-like protein Pup [Candidatus Rokubacteria bacterium]